MDLATITNKIKDRLRPKNEVLLYRINENAEWKVYRRFRTNQEKKEFMQTLDRNHFIEFK